MGEAVEPQPATVEDLGRPAEESAMPWHFCHMEAPHKKLRLPEWDLVQLDPGVRHQLMQMQFEAQAISYAGQSPRARFDIIELDGRPIGRIVVDRPGDRIHIVDQAIVPELRSRGAGTAIMRALMEEAATAGLAVRLMVADSNDPSLKLYSRLGFRQIDQAMMYMEMEWRAPA